MPPMRRAGYHLGSDRRLWGLLPGSGKVCKGAAGGCKQGARLEVGGEDILLSSLLRHALAQACRRLRAEPAKTVFLARIEAGG